MTACLERDWRIESWLIQVSLPIAEVVSRGTGGGVEGQQLGGNYYFVTDNTRCRSSQPLNTCTNRPATSLPFICRVERRLADMQ